MEIDQDWTISARLRRLVQRAEDGQWPPAADRGAIVKRVFVETADQPRRLQIARALEAVVEEMPLHIAPDELIIGARTVQGYPEHLEAIEAGSAEPGYMIADYPRALNDGFLAIIAELEGRLSGSGEPSHVQGEHGREVIESMLVACRAALRLAERHAEAAEGLAATESDPERKAELRELARICRKVPAQPAETFHEALQALWLTHLAIYLECESVAFSLGRMDQYLYPFYLADREAGRLDDDRARELIGCLWVKFYENVRGGIGHVQTVTLGGVTAGSGEGVNELSWLMQQVTRELRNVGPSLATRVCRETPDDYVLYILETMRLGRYMPQLYNDDQMVPALQTKGIPLEDAREYGLIGCHEPTICGKGYFRSASWPGYVCFQDWLELALGDGKPLMESGKSGPETGGAANVGSFDGLWRAFIAQMKHQVAQRVADANRGEEIKARLNPRPMMSALIAGCTEQGLDFTEGGALYNLSGFQAFGLGTCVDALCAIRKFVYEDGEVSLPDLVTILRNDWAGHEDLRQRMAQLAPRWGNDDPAADDLGVAMVRALEGEIAQYTNARGGPFALGLWSFWQHVDHGRQVAASADGRRHGEMMSHSMDPTVGRGMRGPTGAIKSAAKIDTSGLANGGSLLLEFEPKLLEDEEGRRAVVQLIRTYFALGGIQLQLSAVTSEQLEAARLEPAKHRDLVVRVAGYSDYFVRQAAERQEYIVARQKHSELG
ncbi:MAG: pyruvate formate lyase family protein [Armatimonadia bacterium]